MGGIYGNLQVMIRLMRRCLSVVDSMLLTLWLNFLTLFLIQVFSQVGGQQVLLHKSEAVDCPDNYRGIIVYI